MNYRTFLCLRNFQHEPSMTYINFPHARLARDTNNTMDFFMMGLELTKHSAPVQHDTKCSLLCSDTLNTQPLFVQTQFLFVFSQLIVF